MTGDDPDEATTPGHVPLPPEQPPPPSSDPELASTRGEFTLPPAAAEHDVPGPASEPREWWRGDDATGSGADVGSGDVTGDLAGSMQEMGYRIEMAAGVVSDAVATRAYPAARRHGLDIRWMRVKINGPAVVLALLATWGGRTATDRMVDSVSEDGILAPIGWVMFFGILAGVLMLTPLGSPLAHAIAHLVMTVTQGLVALVRRAWTAPVIGYLMRLIIAWAAWAFIFGVLRVAGRGLLHWLTGV